MFKKYFKIMALVAVVPLIFAGWAGADTISLSSSWNLVSARVPITVSDSLSDAAKYTSVWKWDDGVWAVYLPGEADGGAAYATAKGFNSLTTITPGEGFWVNSSESQTLTLSGTEQTDSAISLGEGWNLKGLVTANSINVGSIFSDSSKFASVWKWAGSSWAVHLPGETTPGTYAESKGFAQLSTIAPGEGFWVNASAATDVVATPPVIAGVVTYPQEEVTAAKIALYAAGLLAELPVVEMPPTPGVPVKVYAADDKEYQTPLAEVKTDANGNYSFVAEDFDDAATPEVEMPPQVPVIVRAEFKSPIDPTKKVAVGALVDPTDEEAKGAVEVNPLTSAIAEKVINFVEDTFKIDITKEIMDAAKTFIDLIATQVKEKGLTQFVETDVQIGEYQDEASEEETTDFVAPEQSLADNVIDKGTGGLFESMESALIEKAEDDVTTLGTGAVLDDTKKFEHFIKFFASLGFGVQAGADGADSQKAIFFLPTPPFIPDNQIPGVQMFNDRAFRKIDPVVDLAPEKFVNINDPGLIFQIQDTLHDNPIMSYAALQAIATAAKEGGNTTLAKMASVIKDKFEWKTEGVQMINGIPIFSNYSQTPKTGAEVTASALISKITGKLGDTPKLIASDIAAKPYYIMDMAEMVINEKVHQIHSDPDITDKKTAMDTFFQGLQTFDDLVSLVQSSDEFQQEVENISRRIFSALEPELYGKVLSASTQLKIKTSFLLMTLIMDRDYLIDESEGWFTTKSDGFGTWIEPNFSNVKWLEPKEMSPSMVGEIIGTLIGSEITDGATFGTMVQAFYQGVEGIQGPEQFMMDKDMIQNVGMGTMNAQVTVNGIVKNYDGTDMANMEVKLKYFDMQGVIQDAGSATTDDTGNFTFASVDSGFPYEFRFTGNDFIFPFYVDGFQSDMNMGEIWLPPPGGMGGPMGFPGISLWIDQHFFNPMNPQDENNGKMEGVDFSNFNTEKPFIIFSGSDQGTPDLFWTSEDGLTVSPTALLAGQGNGIASLGEGQDHQHGLGSGPVIDHVFTKDELEGTASITMEGSTFTLNWVDSIAEPGEDNAIYVVRDATGNYYFIEVRWWDKDFQGNPNGMLDMGFAKLGTDGRLDVPKEDFIGGPPMGMPGGPGMGFMFFDMFPGDYLDLETGMFSAPAQEPFGYDSQVAGNADVRWLAGFYDTYWANETNWDTRNAYLSQSDRAISAINNATLSTLTISEGAVTVTEDADGVVKDIIPGMMLLVETADQGKHVLGVNWVEKDAVGLMIIPKDQLMDENGNLQPGVEDGDGDGIPNMLDNDDFNQDVFDDAWVQDQFQMVDADGDGVPAEFDPNDFDPNVPNSGGDKDMDGDGLIGGADPDDNNPNDPIFNGNWDDDGDGWPKAIDPNDSDPNVPGDETGFFGGGKKEDMDGDGIPSDMDPNDNNPDDPVVGGASDNDGDGFKKGEEEWPNMGGQVGNDNDPAVFPGSFTPGDVTIQVSGTAKVGVVWLKEDFPGAPPYWEFMSIYELAGLPLENGAQYSIPDITAADIIGAVPAGWPQFGLDNARAEIVLIDDVDNAKNGPQFDIYPGGDTAVGVAFGYELQMNNGTWQLNELKPGTGPQKVDDATSVTINFGPKY